VTDRARGFLVHLSDDFRIGDGPEFGGADRIQIALESVKGVVKVEPIVSDYEAALSTERAYTKLRDELRDKLWPR
jgi:hypothetical protein